jgi:SAM-dependent methyltransferase
MKPNSRNDEAVAQAFAQPDWYVNGYAANIRVRCETVREFLGARDIRNILDIGCGDGSLSRQLLVPHRTITYLDVSSAMLETAHNKLPPGAEKQCSFIKGDIMAADLAACSFDLVLFVGVLAYLPDAAQVASKINGLLRTGGIVIAECTDRSSMFGRLNFAYRHATSFFRPPPCETYKHDANTVVKTFQASGFRLERTFRYTYSVPIVNRILNQDSAYTLMRRTFGSANLAKRQSLGSELLMMFSKI